MCRGLILLARYLTTLLPPSRVGAEEFGVVEPDIWSFIEPNATLGSWKVCAVLILSAGISKERRWADAPAHPDSSPAAPCHPAA